ncbi:MAG: hypothetical protein U0325_07625 [Polyangiales bacterium]
MIVDAHDLDRFEDLLQQRAARRRRVLRGIRGGVALAVVLLLSLAFSEPLRIAWVRFRLHRLPPPPRALPLVGMERLHAVELPRWMIRLALARGGDYENLRARATMTEIARRAASFPEVSAAAHDILWLDASEPLPWSPWRALPVLQRWNGALERAGLAIHLDGTVETDARGPLLAVNVYRVVFEGAVMVGSRKVRARLLQRIDRTNLVESWLGVVSGGHDSGRVVLDRVRDVALDLLWPMLDPARRDAPARALQREVRAALLPEHVDTLTRTAPVRAAALDVAARINARQRCGSPMAMPRVPWRGFAPEGCRVLLDAAVPQGSALCPRVTLPEARTLAEATVTLADTPRLEGALSALVGHLARSVVVHEARHAADRALGEPPCATCPAHLGAAARSELRAYLTSLADPVTGQSALLQACHASHDAAHTAAWREARAAVGGDPCAAPPIDLGARARAALRARYGVVDDVSLDGRFSRAVRRLP